MRDRSSGLPWKRISLRSSSTANAGAGGAAAAAAASSRCVRRSTVRTLATSSRGENGLAT